MPQTEQDLFLEYYYCYPYEAVALLADRHACRDVRLTGTIWPYVPSAGRTLFTGPCDAERWLRAHSIRAADGGYVLHHYSMEEYIGCFMAQFEPEICPFLFRWLQHPDLDYPLGRELLKVELKGPRRLAQEQYLAAPDSLRETIGLNAGAIGYWQLLNDAPVLHERKEAAAGAWSRWYHG